MVRHIIDTHRYRICNMAGQTTKTNDWNIGGTQIECTKEEFDEEINGNLKAQCTLENAGTFYFVTGGELCETIKELDIHLKFFDEEEGVMHISDCLHIPTINFVGDSPVAVNQNLFMFKDFVMLLEHDWGSSTYCHISKSAHTRIADFYLTQTSVHKTGLSRIKKDATADFTLKAEKGRAIKVHKSVMEGLWPFFKGMLASNMQEVADGFVKFPMPRTTLEVIVRYLYGEELSLKFEDAANLIVFAQMYDLPELLEIATVEVKKDVLTITKAVLLWRKGFEANNEDVRDFASGHIDTLMSETKDFHGKISHLEKDELLCLLQDIS